MFTRLCMAMTVTSEIQNSYSKCSKIINTFLSLSSKECWLSGLHLTKCLSENQTGQTQIRLLLQKQSDLGLLCLPRLLWQANTVPNFGQFTVTHCLIWVQTTVELQRLEL